MINKLKSFFQEYINVFIAIASILLTIGLNISIDFKKNLFVFDGNQIIWIFISVFIYIVLKKAYEYKNKRLKICSLVLSIFLTIFQVLGLITKGSWIYNEVILTKEIVLFIIIKFITYSVIFYNIIKILFSLIEKIKWKDTRDALKANKKNFIVVAILFIIAWLPYFLNYYPGITSYDTNYQLMQGYGVYGYSNHHPILHTLIITNIVKVGYAITGNYNFGIALCSIVQMIFCALTLSFVIYYMGKKKIHSLIKMVTFLIFAFVPFIPQFSIAIWKDVPFAMSMVWFIIGIIEMLTNEEKFFKNKINNFIYVIIILGIMFFRNNGIYIILLTLPFILYWKRKYWKNILVMFIVPITLYYVVTGPIFNKLNISKSSPREMLSIPIQQMARIVKYKSDEISEKDKEIIGQYIKIDEAGQIYNPTISDPIKNEFNDSTFYQDKLNIIKLYLKLAIKFPGETIAAFVGNTYGYYYPEIVTYSVATGTYETPFENEKFMDIHLEPIVKIPLIDTVIKKIYEKDMPVISLIANIGFAFWMMLLMIFYCIYKKKYKYILMFVPIVFLYLTCLASPVSGELRYIYSMFLCLPIFWGFVLKEN